MSEQDLARAVVQQDYVYQFAFATGELAPELYFRSDLAKQRSGAAQLLNFLPHEHPSYPPTNLARAGALNWTPTSLVLGTRLGIVAYGTGFGLLSRRRHPPFHLSTGAGVSWTSEARCRRLVLNEVPMPDLSKSPEDIFKAGVAARVRGEQVAACPYPDESGEREQWLEGWHEPDALDEPDELGFA